ncbi:hypothetical protein COOONC_17022 [Cooperia oncophora]
MVQAGAKSTTKSQFISVISKNSVQKPPRPSQCCERKKWRQAFSTFPNSFRYFIDNACELIQRASRVIGRSQKNAPTKPECPALLRGAFSLIVNASTIFYGQMPIPLWKSSDTNGTFYSAGRNERQVCHAGS